MGQKELSFWRVSWESFLENCWIDFDETRQGEQKPKWRTQLRRRRGMQSPDVVKIQHPKSDFKKTIRQKRTDNKIQECKNWETNRCNLLHFSDAQRIPQRSRSTWQDSVPAKIRASWHCWIEWMLQSACNIDLSRWFFRHFLLEGMHDCMFELTDDASRKADDASSRNSQQLKSHEQQKLSSEVCVDDEVHQWLRSEHGSNLLRSSMNGRNCWNSPLVSFC